MDILFKKYHLIYKNLLSNASSRDNREQIKIIVYKLLLNSNLNYDEKEFLIKKIFDGDEEFMNSYKRACLDEEINDRHDD